MKPIGFIIAPKLLQSRVEEGGRRISGARGHGVSGLAASPGGSSDGAQRFFSRAMNCIQYTHNSEIRDSLPGCSAGRTVQWALADQASMRPSLAATAGGGRPGDHRTCAFTTTAAAFRECRSAPPDDPCDQRGQPGQALPAHLATELDGPVGTRRSDGFAAPAAFPLLDGSYRSVTPVVKLSGKKCKNGGPVSLPSRIVCEAHTIHRPRRSSPVPGQAPLAGQTRDAGPG
jgi:hypothetical protein